MRLRSEAPAAIESGELFFQTMEKCPSVSSFAMPDPSSNLLLLRVIQFCLGWEGGYEYGGLWTDGADATRSGSVLRSFKSVTVGLSVMSVSVFL